MRHTVNNILLSAAVAATICSCSSVLEEVNPTEITGVYESERLLEADVAGITLSHFIRVATLEFICSASGLTTWGVTGEAKYSQTDYTHCMNFCIPSTMSTNKDLFINQYKAIQRANLIMHNLPSSPVDEAYKLEIEAECKFLRAIAYFNLVRYYGDVPLRLAPPTAEDATNCPRAPYYEVYAQIVRDLEFASQNMRSPERADEISPVDFRPNKFAATAYLSSVFTQIASLLAHPDDNFWDSSKPERCPDFSSIGVKTADDAYRLALKYAELVLPESPTHDPACRYRLVEKISDLYQFTSSFSRNGYTSWRNPEQIMVTSCSVESSNNDYYTQRTTPNYCPDTQQFLSSDNTARVRPSRFIFEKWCDTYPGNMGTGSFSEVHVSSSDPRVDATLWYGNITLCTGSVTTTYPYSSTVGRANSMPYYKKYWSAKYTGSFGDSDYYDMRLAEVYLNAAEAAAWLNDGTTARKYIEVLHARARHSVTDGQPDAVQPSWADRDFADRDELVEAIFWERQFELIGEGHDFTDTHRFGAAWLADVLAGPLNKFYALSINAKLFGKHYAPGVDFLEDKKLLRNSLLCPLPQLETSSNSGISSDNDFSWGI